MPALLANDSDASRAFKVIARDPGNVHTSMSAKTASNNIKRSNRNETVKEAATGPVGRSVS